MKEFAPGEILDGRYEIRGAIGAGGMGRVYRAQQLNLDRAVAIKVPSQAVLENPQYLTRFIREAQACAKVAHENIVAIYDVKEGDSPYIVMEFVNGLPLHRFLKEEHTAVFVQDLLDIISQICEGLAAAHAKGVVHRDIKPGNIVITANTQRVKIMDFGIARVADTPSMTSTGSMMGTPYYMAPEQIRGEPVGPETDIYALACLVYRKAGFRRRGRHAPLPAHLPGARESVQAQPHAAARNRRSPPARVAQEAFRTPPLDPRVLSRDSPLAAKRRQPALYAGVCHARPQHRPDRSTFGPAR